MHRVLLAIFLVFLPLVAGAGGDSVSQESIFWPTSGIGDGTATGYTSDQWKWAMRMMWLNDPTTQGVAVGFLNDLEVTNPGGRTLRVASGGAIVYGSPYRNTQDVDFTLTLPVIATTGWRLILRSDWEAQTVRLVLLESADGVAAIPGVTQTAGVTWDITLTTGTITVVPVVAITDARAFFLDNGRLATRTRRLFITTSTAYDQTNTTQLFKRALDGIYFPDLAIVSAYGWFTVPDDYVAGTPMIVTAVVVPGALGDIRAEHYAEFAACGEPVFTHQVNVIATTNISISLNSCINALTLAGVATGDLVSLRFIRDSVNVLDTIGTTVGFMGWYVDYTADM